MLDYSLLLLLAILANYFSILFRFAISLIINFFLCTILYNLRPVLLDDPFSFESPPLMNPPIFLFLPSRIILILINQ